MANSIQIGNEITIGNRDYEKRLGLRVLDGGSDTVDLQLVRYDTNGQFAETILTVDGETGAVNMTANNARITKPYRSVAANGALTWTSADANGCIRLTSSTDASAKAATVVTTGFVAGDTLQFHLLLRSSTGTYTIAASSLTVTLDATGEGCMLVFDGTAWQIAGLTGGATAA